MVKQQQWLVVCALMVGSMKWADAAPSELLTKRWERKLTQEYWWDSKVFNRKPDEKNYSYRSKVSKEEPIRLIPEVQKIVKTQKTALAGLPPKPEIYEKVQGILKQPGSIVYSAFLNQVNIDWFNRSIAPSLNRGVFLAFGNSKSEIGEKEAAQLGPWLKATLNQGYWIAYDADSAVAPLIVSEVPREKRLGISGRDTQRSEEVLVVTNPYQRMELLSRFKQIVFTPDSILGVGLLFEYFSDIRFLVLDPANQWVPGGLPKWDRSFLLKGVEKLGRFRYSSSQEPEVIQDPATGIGPIPVGGGSFYSSTMESDYRLTGSKWAVPLIQLEFTLNHMTPSVLQSTEFAQGYSDRVRLLYNKFEDFKLNRRAVVFGSGHGSRKFEKKVEVFVEFLVRKGYSIATGGAGGFMKTANQAAFRLGGLSIGIPLSGSFRIASEMFSVDQYHHLTLNAPGYAMRIPLLLEGENVVVIAPGGSGTLKELSTTWVDEAAQVFEKGDGRFQVFLSSLYYGELVTWIKSLPLPAEFLGRISVERFDEDQEEKKS